MADLTNEQRKAMALELVNAYFDDTKDILVKDEGAGLMNWTNIKSREFWTYLEEFILHTECYKIIDK